MMESYKETLAQERCLKNCIIMNIYVDFKGYSEDLFGYTNIVLDFKKSFVYKFKHPSYTWFRFVIDIGSSIGVWLGKFTNLLKILIFLLFGSKQKLISDIYLFS